MEKEVQQGTLRKTGSCTSHIMKRSEKEMTRVVLEWKPEERDLEVD